MSFPMLRASSFFALTLLAAAPLAGCLEPGPDTTGDQLTDASQVGGGTQMAVGANGIYFANTPDWVTSHIARIPLGGGAPVTLEPNPVSPTWMTLDLDSVYYSETIEATNDMSPSIYKISRVSQAGGASQTLVSGTDVIEGAAVAGERLVYATVSTDASGQSMPGTGAIFAQPITVLGQPPAASTPLVQGLPGPCALAADDARVYWIDCTSTELLSLPLSPATGEKPAVLFSGVGISPMSLTVAAGHLYWIEGSAVRTMPAAGGAPITIDSRSDWAPVQIMADATAVYWLTAADYEMEGVFNLGPVSDDQYPGLWTANAGGGPVSQVLGVAASPIAMAMDADYLYWVSQKDRSVRRAHR